MLAALEVVARLLTDDRAGAAQLPWWELRYQHTQAVRAALLDARYAAATVRKTLSALRGVLQECWRLGLMAADDYHRAVDLPSVSGERLPAGRGLGAGELRALFAACCPSPSRTLDAAVLALLYGAGLRRAEAVAVDLADYQPADGALVVRAPKGGRERRAFVTGGAQAAVDAWLTTRGSQPGPLLCPVRKNGVITIRRMTPMRSTDASNASAGTPASPASPPTTSAAASSPTSSTPAPISPPSRPSQATAGRKPPSDTTAGPIPPGAELPPCCTSHTPRSESLPRVRSDSCLFSGAKSFRSHPELGDEEGEAQPAKGQGGGGYGT